MYVQFILDFWIFILHICSVLWFQGVAFFILAELLGWGNLHLMLSHNYFLPCGGTHLLLQMNVHKASHLSSKGQRAILIGFTAQSHYTAQLANIVLRLLLLMRLPLLKNEHWHSANSGLLPQMSPGFLPLFGGLVFVKPEGSNVYYWP